MKRYGVIALILTAMLVVAFWRLNQVPPAPKAADLLPGSTVLYLECPDFNRIRSELPRTAAYALWQEPQVQVFAQSLQRSFLETLGASKKQQRIGALSFLDPAKGEVFFAVTDLSAQSRFGFKAVLGLDVQQNFLATRMALAYRELRMRSWNRNARFYTKEHRGIRYRVWALTPQFRLHHVFLNSLLVYSLDEDTLCGLIDRFTGAVPKNFTPLRATPEYQNAMSHLRPTPQFVAYLNPTLLPKSWPVSRWLSRADVIALGTTFLDDQIRDVIYSAYFTPQVAPPPLTRFQTIVLTTPHTTFYRVGNADWKTIYREFTEILTKSDNPSLSPLPNRLERSLRHNGIRPDEDIFHFLGPETALLANWRQGARLPDVALAVELRNPEQVRLRLDVAMTALKDAMLSVDRPTPWDITQFHGETLHTLRLNTGAIAPTYFTTDKFLVLTSTPDCARELINQLKELVPTLAMNPDYQQTMKRLPAHLSTCTYGDPRAIVPPLLAHVQTGLRICPNQFVHADKLPGAEALTRHLSPIASTTLAKSHGRTTITISPLGVPLTTSLGALAAYFAIRPHLTASPAAPTTSSSTNVPPLPRENPTASSQTLSP